MLLRPFNFYLSLSMCGNLFMIFLCVWFLLGFIGYGIERGSRGRREHYIATILIIIVSMLFGPPFFIKTIQEHGFYRLRFW